MWLFHLFEQTLDADESLSLPFDSYLEAPEPIVELWQAHGAPLREGLATVREATSTCSWTSSSACGSCRRRTR